MIKLIILITSHQEIYIETFVRLQSFSKCLLTLLLPEFRVPVGQVLVGHLPRGVEDKDAGVRLVVIRSEIKFNTVKSIRYQGSSQGDDRRPEKVCY